MQCSYISVIRVIFLEVKPRKRISLYILDLFFHVKLSFIQPFIQRYTNDYKTVYVPDDNRDFASRSSNVDATSASAGSMLLVKGNRVAMHFAGATVTLRKKVRVRTMQMVNASANRVSRRRNCSHVHYETALFRVAAS